MSSRTDTSTSITASSSSSSSSSAVAIIQALLPTTALGITGFVAASAFIIRTIKRTFFSPTIVCPLSCHCGQIQGFITAKREDSIRINCYCNDCRTYANYITQTLGKDPSKTTGKYYTQVVQVCKSDITITKGAELLGLARKGPPATAPKGAVYMHRYYAKCCHVPLMNTVDFLGFVGIFTDFLDNNQQQKFAGPVKMFPEEALKKTEEGKDQELNNNTSKEEEQPDDIFVLDFLWKLVRYLPWSKSGPFDYNLQPAYWGGAPLVVLRNQEHE